MYWDNGTGEACHDSIGMSAPHTTFYLPGRADLRRQGDLDAGAEPQRTAVAVKMSYLTPAGTGNKVRSQTPSPPTPARPTTWQTRDTRRRGHPWSVATPPEEPIMVERAMYWNSRGAGTDTIGGYSD